MPLQQPSRFVSSTIPPLLSRFVRSSQWSTPVDYSVQNFVYLSWMNYEQNFHFSLNSPTYFFQHILPFIDSISNVMMSCLLHTYTKRRIGATAIIIYLLKNCRWDWLATSRHMRESSFIHSVASGRCLMSAVDFLYSTERFFTFAYPSNVVHKSTRNVRLRTFL